MHRLFVCIAGVADQLQTNFASDLRNILKCVFLMNSTQSANEDEPEQEEKRDSESPPSPVESNPPSGNEGNESPERQTSTEDGEDEEPIQEDETRKFFVVIVMSDVYLLLKKNCIEAYRKSECYIDQTINFF